MGRVQRERLQAITEVCALTVNELMEQLLDVDGNAEVGIIDASSGNPNQKESGVFRLLKVNSEHGVNLVASKRVVRFIPIVEGDEQ